MKRLGLLIICIACVSAAYASNPFINEHEGESAFISSREAAKSKEIIETLPMQVKDQLILAATSYPEDPRKICAFDQTLKIKNTAKDLGLKSKRVLPALLTYLRLNNQLDDLSYLMLYDMAEAVQKSFSFSPLSENSAETESFVGSFKNFSNELKTSCVERSFKKLAATFGKRIDVKSEVFEVASRMEITGVISRQEEAFFQIAYNANVHTWGITLADYAQKVLNLKKQRKVNEISRSNFVSAEQEKGRTYRTSLLTSFEFHQVILMSKLINKMKDRLNSNNIEIQIKDDEGNITETIELDPMERYRFVIKMVRKELSVLNNTTLFDGRKVSYMDLVVAAFEMGTVTSTEIEVLAEIEEIWNPKTTRKEKVVAFIKKYGMLTTILLPPELQIIQVLAMIVIEATSEEKASEDREHSIF